MNTAISTNLQPRGLARPGIAGLAIRAGRALERWGRRHAAPMPSRDELAAAELSRREAELAIASHRSVVVGTGLPPAH